MDNEKVIKLQHFFEADLRIKQEMINSSPPNYNGVLDERSLNAYASKVEDSLNYIFAELKCVTLDLFTDQSFIFQRIVELEKNTKQVFYNSCNDFDRLKSFYQRYVTDMNPLFIDDVKKKCVGYALFSGIPIEKANTVNEALHAIHSSILNNEHLLQSIPVVQEKINPISREPISLRGADSPIFRRLHDMFPDTLDVGITDMVCLGDNRMLMMVRDRGHALTIEITLKNEFARLEYFIPKICNVDMVNALPGVRKVETKDSPGTVGVIETPLNDLPNVLFDFISRVPTDLDIVLDNVMYR